MEAEKYVKLSDVEELLKRIEIRDKYQSHTTAYELQDRIVNELIKQIKDTAIIK